MTVFVYKFYKKLNYTIKVLIEKILVKVTKFHHRTPSGSIFLLQRLKDVTPC